MAMFLFVIAFIGVVVLLAALGWVADSRDGADWTPTDSGFRRPRPL
jgi:hypothetical protein